MNSSNLKLSFLEKAGSSLHEPELHRVILPVT